MNNIRLTVLMPYADRVTGITVWIFIEHFNYLSHILHASGTG